MKKSLLTVLSLCLCSFYCGAKITYVNIAATSGLQNGTSWANAYTNLDSALAFVKGLDTVWVANGNYKGNGSTVEGFLITDSAKVFGGFSGTETQLSQRNWSTFQTVLLPLTVYNAPSATIVWFAGTPRTFHLNQRCRLDGFKISGADATANGSYFFPAAPIMISPYISRIGEDSTDFYNTKIDIANCLISNNTGRMGGALSAYNYGKGEINITNCRFENNSASITGGAIFRGNSTGVANSLQTVHGAGSIYRMTITDCVFKGNTAPYGGAITVWDSNTIINRCSFIGNVATADGGAIYDTMSAQLSVYNSLFAGNKAQKGAAHYAAAATAAYQPQVFVHNTFATNVNTDTYSPSYTVTLRSTADVLRNCILWDNVYSSSGGPVPVPAGTPNIQGNLIQGPAITGTIATVSFNPVFQAPGAVSAVPFPVSASYDYRLALYSPAIDTAANLALAAPYNLDLDDSPRVFGTKPDLGAYERVFCSIHSTITASGPTDFCLPGSVTLTASPHSVSGGPSYSQYWNASTTPATSVVAAATGLWRVINVGDAGCRGSASIMVNAVPAPNPAISWNGAAFSVSAIYATYQWYKGGAAIAGATGPSYSPKSNGVYTVKVTTVIGGCAGTSAAFNLANLSVGNTAASEGIGIYPNPVQSELHITGLDHGSYQLSDIAGRILLSGRAYPGSAIDVSSIAGGIYMLYLHDDAAKAYTIKLIKE